MVSMEIKNIVELDENRIDCEINHPLHGWIPFTANKYDCTQHGPLIYEAAKELLAKGFKG